MPILRAQRNAHSGEHRAFNAHCLPTGACPWQRSGSSEQAVREAMASSVPARRLGTAADFGPLCAFLASPLAGYITGQNICVEGGLTKNVV